MNSARMLWKQQSVLNTNRELKPKKFGDDRNFLYIKVGCKYHLRNNCTPSHKIQNYSFLLLVLSFIFFLLKQTENNTLITPALQQVKATLNSLFSDRLPTRCCWFVLLSVCLSVCLYVGLFLC